jgi:rpsU-divergently transcribed protein
MKELKNKLLDFAIELSRGDPLTEEFIDTISEKANINSDSLNMLFPRGLEDFANYFFERVDSFMLGILSDDLYTLPIHIQVSKLLEARFAYMDQNKAFSLSILKMRAKLTYKAEHILKVADLIWQNVNHKSSGIDFYTRRLILSNLYKNCLLHFKKDVTIKDMNCYLHKELKFIGNITKLKKKLCRAS